MPFTATVNSIARSGGMIAAVVTYNDSVTGWNTQNNFSFPDDNSMTPAQMRTQILTQGTFYKNSLNQGTTLQSYVGTVLVI